MFYSYLRLMNPLVYVEIEEELYRVQICGGSRLSPRDPDDWSVFFALVFKTKEMLGSYRTTRGRKSFCAEPPETGLRKARLPPGLQLLRQERREHIRSSDHRQ